MSADDTTHFQWFYFRVAGCKGKDLHLKIVNAGDSSFPVAWPKYNTCASYDAITMFRIPSAYDKAQGVLSWKIKPEHVGQTPPPPPFAQLSALAKGAMQEIKESHWLQIDGLMISTCLVPRDLS